MSDLENSQKLPKEAEFVGETNEENPPIPYEAEPSTSKNSPKDEVDSKLGVEAEHVEIPFEDPPEFSQYEAEFTVSDSGNILSHDHHLNEDGEALYRFLLQHVAVKPNFLVNIHGHHNETRTRSVRSTDSNGRTVTRTERYTVTITDFQFSINLTSNIVSGPTHFTVADNEPAYRGLMIHQIDKDGVRRKPNPGEKSAASVWVDKREERGLPPWLGPHQDESRWPEGIPLEYDALKSSKTLRQWSDEYVASRKILKEFKYQKYIYGWNLESLEQSIRQAILDTYYSNTVEIHFTVSADKIRVRSDNGFSRALSKKWLVVILWITLIYPFIWLFKRFSSRGGGKWEVCGGAFSLVHLEPIGVDCPLGHEESAIPPENPPRIVEHAMGIFKVVGKHEQEWFQEHRHVIQRGVNQRFTGGHVIHC